ncbi:ATP-dependent sacrificial sulfur transferase LarE [Rubeoparvulum massiliense]|uniref:ATP-dependent sacrificial sulfur transferase LarE n=1 Tax=Rubeoparvulum massiliense TaxID=1631346 RepID=UPI00065E0C83|nr:ATP-dependent sacrificial sulfur transferase LarE [Rubeoparvulum massiliense]
MDLYEKNQVLGQLLSSLERCLVAFSGGVDSTFLLARAYEQLGDQVSAVIAASETFPVREYDAAMQLALQLHVPVIETSVSELTNPHFVNNQKDRCYHCKHGLYSHLNQLAKKLNFPYILDGTNHDDLGDYRPGLEAKEEQGIRSPLLEVGLTKAEIRQLSKEMNLPTWNKPSFACLSSRIPYGQVITQTKIDQLDAAEHFLLELGFYQVRVRHHGEMARIEVLPAEMERVVQSHERILPYFQALGFTYVTLDLQGYRTGSMNEVLQLKEG